MNLNGWILDVLARWLRLDQESMIRFPPGACDRVLVEWFLLLLEIYALVAVLWIGWRSMRRSDDPPRPSLARTLRAVLLALGAAAVFYGALEWAVRGYVATQAQPNFLPHPLYLWRFRPNLRDFELMTPAGPMHFDTNAEGLRDADVAPVKPPDEFRIVVLGDSATFGQSVPQEQIYSAQLQKLLTEKYPGRKFRVINGGVPGYSMLQGYYRLQRELMDRYHPDLVVVNEFNEFSNRQLGEFDSVVPRSELECRLKELLWSSTVYMTARKMAARFSHPGLVPSPVLTGPREVLLADEETVDYLKRFIALFKRTGTRAIFVMWRRPGYWSETYRQLLAGEDPSRLLAADYNPYLLQQHGKVFWLPNDPSHHPSATGHLLMAQALLRTIVERRMVGE